MRKTLAVAVLALAMTAQTSQAGPLKRLVERIREKRQQPAPCSSCQQSAPVFDGSLIRTVGDAVRSNFNAVNFNGRMPLGTCSGPGCPK